MLNVNNLLNNVTVSEVRRELLAIYENFMRMHRWNIVSIEDIISLAHELQRAIINKS